MLGGDRRGSSIRRIGIGVLPCSLLLAGCLTNRTFLAWTSSGLETAQFNFLFIAWFYLIAFRAQEDRPSIWALACLTAALICLTRPDGLLHVGATLLLVLHWMEYRAQ